MVIYIDQHRTGKAAPASWLKNGTYGDEVMQASWNPAVIDIARDEVQPAPSPELPDDLSVIDVNAFLARVYGLATLI